MANIIDGKRHSTSIMFMLLEKSPDSRLRDFPVAVCSRSGAQWIKTDLLKSACRFQNEVCRDDHLARNLSASVQCWRNADCKQLVHEVIACSVW